MSHRKKVFMKFIRCSTPADVLVLYGPRAAETARQLTRMKSSCGHAHSIAIGRAFYTKPRKPKAVA